MKCIPVGGHSLTGHAHPIRLDVIRVLTLTLERITLLGDKLVLRLGERQGKATSQRSLCVCCHHTGILGTAP